jgi:catechol 2,3-dioxygenase
MIESAAASPVPPEVRVGHVHLRVSDLDRATAFYRDVLGFTVTAYGPPLGLPASFLAAGDYHHHIGLNTFESAGASPPPPGHTGLYHFALLYPDRSSLARAVARLLEHGIPVRGIDHGGTVSVYLEDPDRNGIELYYDRPKEAWRDAEGRPVLKAEPFSVHELASEANPSAAVPTLST